MIEKKSFWNRVLVGIAIFVVMAGMILADIYMSNWWIISGRAINSVIIYVLILLSVVEMRRAFGKERIPDCFSWLLWLYGFGLGPAYSLFGFIGIIFFTLIVFICAVVTSLYANRPDSLVYVACMLVYPGLFMASLLYINRCASTQTISAEMQQYVEKDIWQYLGYRESYLLPLNAIGLALVFAVSSFTDVFAYFVGSLFGKHKLCPQISPNKTIEGAIGGVFGGCLGAFLIFVLFDWAKIFGVQYGLTFSGLGLSNASVAVVYAVIGFFGSIMTQIGDLLASHVKRFCGIKDYSHVLGAHGGIMDRFDGIMLNALFISFVFMFII